MDPLDALLTCVLNLLRCDMQGNRIIVCDIEPDKMPAIVETYTREYRGETYEILLMPRCLVER